MAMGRDNLNDVRELACSQFIFDDEFIKSQEFKEFVLRSKREEYLKILQFAQVDVPREKYD